MRRALIVLFVMLLAGCRVDTTVDITMGQDGSGHITVTAIADAGVVEQAPGLKDDLRFDDLVRALAEGKSRRAIVPPTLSLVITIINVW